MRVRAGFKRFWTAEELPRWFGLSIVLIYLVGLGAVGYVGVCLSRPPSDAGVMSELIRLPNAAARQPLHATLVEENVAPLPELYLKQARPLMMSRKLSRTVTLADLSGVLIVVLVVLGALFVVYRRARRALRTTTRIADRLTNDASSMEGDLASLRLTDAEDIVAEGWNRLIDFSDRLRSDLDRVQANGELTQMLQRGHGGALPLALNALQDGLIHLDRDGCIAYINSTACHLIGGESSELSGMQLVDVPSKGASDEVLDVIRGALKPGGAVQNCNQLVQAKDDESWYQVWVTPLERIDHAGGCLAVIRDVSQQVRAERTREDFVTQVTHELRTPLTNIRAYAETLSSGMFDDPKVITECYNVINKETRRLSRLIEDMLSASQMEVGGIELALDSVDLKALISDGVTDVRGLADENGIDLQVKLPSKLEPIRADRDKLAIVVNNLLGNAIKYTPKGGRVDVSVQMKSDEVVITFKDSGIGIDPRDHERIFEKFQRADDPAVQDIKGTGIGLYTAREIVRRHGGDIELMSKKGDGATFVVRIQHCESRASALSTTREA